jgi:hypothetical protein
MPQFWMGLFVLLMVVFAGLYIWIALRHRDRVSLLSLASWIALGIAFFMVFHVITLMVYPAKIQEVDHPIKILNPNHQVKRGEYLILQIHVKKYIDKGSTIYPSILCQDGTYITYPSRESNVPIGEGTYTLSNAFQIPADAPFTTCHTRSTDVFKINIFREKSFIHQSEDFQIIE